MDWDVFNGDADGICSLIQLRLEDPRDNAMLVTGPKRDIVLLERVLAEPSDRVTVLDVSMAKNRDHLSRVLGEGAEVFYADHHDPGEPFEHARLDAHINTAGEMCTAAIVNAHLRGAWGDWAVVGAYGDNMDALAQRLAGSRDLPLKALQELGRLINYNGYGASLEDLHYHPDALFKLLVPYGSPEDFLDVDEEIVPRLREGYADDWRAAEAAEVLVSDAHVHAVMMEDEAGARRISGMFGNQLASDHPERAHAVLTRRGDVFVVSIRAPIATRQGAVDLAKRFPTGGGRAAAAGVNALPEKELGAFLEAFEEVFGDGGVA